MKKNRCLWILSMFVASALLSGCGGSPKTQPPPHVSGWTWVGGADVVNQSGVYGTQGTPSSSNIAGARQGAVSWTDSSGNLWLFGGGGYDSAGTFGFLNDLWRFDGSKWTWVNGANTVNQAGVYGTQGSASPSNVPGARETALTWTDSSGNLWLLGGYGLDAAGFSVGHLNDLWKFDGSNWTWVSGADTVQQTGVYGTQGSADPSNVPGSRDGAVAWKDSSGNIWLFGGDGLDAAGTLGGLNDLWKFDSNQWAWIKGSDLVNQAGLYGTQGMASPANAPGARWFPVSWTDGSGHFWLLGGVGLDSAATLGDLNDLWEFDGSNWIWVSGANVANQAGVYGTQGATSPSSWPGGRWQASSRTDGSGNLWLFGGFGFDSGGAEADLNDLWKFDGQKWTWVSGGNLAKQVGVYGTKGTGSQSNVPGARRSSVLWIDNSGNVWVFGGLGYDSTGTLSELNDLWRFQR
jgi:N-acetylneuraminic acid mutarotase